MKFTPRPSTTAFETTTGLLLMAKYLGFVDDCRNSTDWNIEVYYKKKTVFQILLFN